MTNEILFRKEGNIGIFQINRPETQNTINLEFMDEMDKVLDEIIKDSQLKVLIFIGNKDFCSGGEVGPMVNCKSSEAKAFTYKDVFLKVKNLEIPTIAAVAGCAYGGGMELALACDLRMVARNAKLALPEVNLGIMPGAGGTVFLTEVVGPAKAKEIILFGSVMSGEEAFDMGIAHKLSTEETLEEDVLKWAKRLAGRPINSLKAIKRSINYSLYNKDIKGSLHYEAEQFSDLFNTEDQTEGMTAYVEGRKPNFKDQ